MQIILTEEEYNKLCAKSNDFVKISQLVEDYKRRFRLALGNELIGIGRHACGLSVGDIKTAVESAEKIAAEIK